MGDFYELFFNDAVRAAAALDIALTKRGKHQGEDIPMCGVPVHSAETYLQRLIKKGFRVAVCEQTESPAEAFLMRAVRITYCRYHARQRATMHWHGPIYQRAGFGFAPWIRRALEVNYQPYRRAKLSLLKHFIKALILWPACQLRARR